MPATSFQKCSICNTSFHKHQSDLHTYHILFMFKSQYFMRETLQKIGFSKIFCIKKCINIMYQWTLTNKLCLPLRYVILTTSTQKAFCKWFILLTNLLYEEYLYDQLERMVSKAWPLCRKHPIHLPQRPQNSHSTHGRCGICTVRTGTYY